MGRGDFERDAAEEHGCVAEHVGASVGVVGRGARRRNGRGGRAAARTQILLRGFADRATIRIRGVGWLG
jgi:hypothetical protein